MEIFRKVSIDWLGKKWIFFGISWVLLIAGIVGYIVRGGFAWGIDFTGGTQITLKFNQKPDLDKIRKSLKPEAVGETIIQRFGNASENTVLIRMQTMLTSEKDMSSGRRELQSLLQQAFDPEHASTALLDFNNVGFDALNRYLESADPDQWKTQNKSTQEISSHYQEVTQTLLDERNRKHGGLVSSVAILANGGVSNQVLQEIEKGFYFSPFAIKGVESLGAVVGSDLRNRAAWAVGFSFLGMMIYIGLRFKPIFGVGAIIALFHDLTITLGLFAITQKEISLTVIAALLTLVGYSVNDTIVIFDRVRENLRTMRKESLYKVINLSINQTISRTILTSGMTFLSVFALFLFGGEVLNGFAFALTVGILVGTYSTLSIATPIVDWWYRSSNQKVKGKAGA